MSGLGCITSAVSEQPCANEPIANEPFPNEGLALAGSVSPPAAPRNADLFAFIVNLHRLWVFFSADRIISCVSSLFRARKVSFPEPLDKRLDRLCKPSLFLGCRCVSRAVIYKLLFKPGSLIYDLRWLAAWYYYRRSATASQNLVLKGVKKKTSKKPSFL